MAKVIIIDNFGREYISDRLHIGNISMEVAEKIARDKNKEKGENSQDYYKAVEDSYVLHDAYKDLP